MQKEKEDRQKEEAEKKANEDKSKLDGLDTGRTNEDVQQSDGEGNDMASSHDKIGPLDDSPTHQV